MSHRNIESVDSAVEALNETYRTGDTRPWRQLVEATFDRDVVLEADEAFTEGEWRGHEGVVRFVASQMEVLDEMWLRVDDYVHLEDDCVVVAITFGGRARHTGLEVELHPLHVFTLRDGKAVRWQVFLERERALEAAGVQE
jgi:ketosteroid isomerase-like protein